MPFPPHNPITPNEFITGDNGFLPSASYDSSELNGILGGGNLVVDYNNPTLQSFNVNGMDFKYTGDTGNNQDPLNNPGYEKLEIDTVTEDLIYIISGYDNLTTQSNWTYMPTSVNPPNPPNPSQPDPPTPSPHGDIISIKTQEKAQQALERIDDAIVAKDKVRAHLGALQNRLENTVTNLTVQSENLQTAESRISDIDVATEMTALVRNQVLTQSAVAMLGQANSYPHMLSGLITS